MIKKMIIEVVDKETQESLEKITVSRARILRQDSRAQENHMRANALDIARRIFCKEYEEDIRTMGLRYDFSIIETVRG